MLRLLTFASGLVAGIVGVGLIKKTVKISAASAAASPGETFGDKARHGLDRAQSGLRQATVSGLTTIEKSTAHLREKLTAAPTATPAPSAKPLAAKRPPRTKLATDVAKPKAAGRPSRKKPPAAPRPTGSETES